MGRIIIVGGGPAGCAAAITAARAGVEVLLLESGHPDRDKPCGDGFLQSAIDLLVSLGLTNSDFVACGGSPFSQLVFALDGRDPVRHTAQGGWILPRRLIDERLRTLASMNSRVAHENQVLDVRPVRLGAWSIQTRRGGRLVCESSDAVIIATGASAHLAGSLGLAGNPIRAASVTAYLQGPEIDALHFHLGHGYPRGYGWVFPIGARLVNCGICSLRGPHHHLNDSLHRFARTVVREGIGAANRIRGGVGPLWSGDLAPRHHEAGAVSCGDSAGVADALTGEGLTSALASGIAAGEAVARFVREGHARSALEDYSAWLRAFCIARYSPTPLRTRFQGWLSGWSS